MARSRGARRQGRIHQIVLAGTIIAGATIVGSCRHSDAAPANPSRVLRLGTSQLNVINPAAGLRQLSQYFSLESLIRLGEDGRFEPALAEKWTIADGGRSLLLTLRAGVKFHDGSTFDASTVVTLLPDGLRSFWGSLADDVDHVKAVDTRTVEIGFRRASPLLQEMLEVTIRKPGSSIVGTGPFMVAPDSTTTFRANPDYYLGAPRINEIDVTSFPATRTAWAELLRNRIDMLWEVAPDALDSLQSSTTVAVFTVTRHYQYVLAFNTEKAALRSAEVRRALNMAVDHTALVAHALNGHGLPSSGPLWQRYWALPTPLPRFEFNPSAAAEIVRAGRAATSTTFLRFKCLVLADAVYERIALELKRQFEAVGVDMDLEAMPPDQLFAAEKSRNFDAVLFEVISAPTALRVYYLWHSQADGNPGGFGNRTVDSALDVVARAEDEGAYRKAINGLQQAFINDPPAIFLAWSERARAISKRFVVPPPQGGRDVNSTIWLWSPRNIDARFASRN